jgi:DNA-binding HxlR family transcriptional regulator
MKSEKLSTKRVYDQFCGLARALDLVGERWTLLLVRDLSLGPQRYSDLLAGLPGIGTGLLAERLKTLEAEGVVRRAQLPAPATGTTVYELTDDGRALAEAMLPLAVWGARRLDLDAVPAPGTYRPEWLFLSLRAQFRPERARGVRDDYEFHVEGHVVHARVRNGTIDIVRGPVPGGHADLVVTTDVPTLLAVGVGHVTPGEAVAAGRMDVAGDPAAMQRALEILGPA